MEVVQPNMTRNAYCKAPDKGHVWGLISISGASRLHIVERNMKSGQYLHILQSRAVAQFAKWLVDGQEFFMLDETPCHKANICKDFWPINLSMLQGSEFTPQVYSPRILE